MARKVQKKTQISFPLDRALADYAVLKVRVGEVLVDGRARIEKELMRMRYYTGLLINEHVRLNSKRAMYGSQAIAKLEKDFKIERSELQRYAQFARAYPIVGGRRQLAFNLPWTHYRKLMVVPDEKVRERLTTQAEKSIWSFEEIKAKVRYAVDKSEAKEKITQLAPVILGNFYTYQIIRSERGRGEKNKLLLDCGFSLKKELRQFRSAGSFKEGLIIASNKDARGRYSLKKFSDKTLARTQADLLYTYRAYVLKVIDGDTLKVDFDLGFGDLKGETIRLNHINCPEQNTPEGRAAKHFVKTQLARTDFIVVKSVRTRKEKWGRYLGDVFLPRKGNSPVYLNQLLLDKRHAVRLRA